MADITLSKAVRSNLLSLKGTAEMMASTQNRLATGNKVNSALDNPSSWFTAQGLNNRASDLNGLLDSMANGVKTLEAADNGLSAMTKTLESMQSTLRQARQDKSFETRSFEVPADATGALSISGGAVEGSVGVELTAAKPAAYAGNGDYALQGVRNGSTIAFDDAANGAAFAAGYEIKFTATIDGETVNATIDFDIAKAATAGNDGDISTDAEMGEAIKRALNAQGISDDRFEVDTTTDIKLTSKNDGPNSQFSISQVSKTIPGTDAQSWAATSTIGFGTVTANTNTAAQTSTFTINFDGKAGPAITLSGATSRTAQEAATSINAQIKTFNDANIGNELEVTASVKDGRIVLQGPKDGSGDNYITLTAATNSAGVFGSAPASNVGAVNGGAVKTVDQLVTEINAKTRADGSANPLYGAVRASNDNGKLRLENQSTKELSIGGANDGNKLDGTTSGEASAKIGGNKIRADLAAQFNELRDQLDKLADDASFNGINLLRGDKLTITFNETGTSAIDIQTKEGETVNALNLGVPTQLEPEELDSDVSIDGLLMDLKAGLDEVRSQASTFGSNLSIVQNRKAFTEAMINTLETGAGNLTLADMNTEAANLLALQTRQQLSQNSLSLASQADQSILQLLR